MEIISWNFLLFVFLFLSVYYLLNRKAQNIWLLFASVIFITTWRWQYLIPLLVTGFSTFIIAKNPEYKHKPLWLCTGVMINLMPLFLNRLIDLSGESQIIQLADMNGVEYFLTPMGLSFYALQSISYLIDTYRSRIKPEKNLFDFYLYLAFFLKFLAGPIERAGNFLPQLKKDRVVNNNTISQGFYLILVGLIRKTVIAQILLSILPEHFIHADIINTKPYLGLISFPFVSYTSSIAYFDRWAGIIGYGIYLYNDFAGYTGIMRGISLFFGFNLSPNFMVPYFAVSFSDFWNRWHISLSSWLRDYLYFPISRYLKENQRNLSSLLLITIPIIFTMLASSLWHGFTSPYLIWGLVYTVMMVLEQWIFLKWPAFRPQRQAFLFKVLRGFFIFICVTFAWVPFTAASPGETLAFWKTIAKGSGWFTSPSFNPWIWPLLILSLIVDVFEVRYKDENFIFKYPMIVRSLILAVTFLILFLAITWSSPSVTNVFLYQNF